MLILDRLGMQLHDRYTQGETLTVDEQAHLEEWYHQKDDLEAQQLNQIFTNPGTVDLQAQVEMALTHLGVAIQRVQQIATENNKLRQEISALRQQLFL